VGLPETGLSLLAQLKHGDADESTVLERILQMDAEESVPMIRSVLLGRDAEWKAVVLERIVALLPRDIVLELAPDLLTLAMTASEADMDAGVDEWAEELLSRLFQR